MSASSRAGTSTDAIQGVVPRVVYEPATVAQAAQLVGASARAGETLAFVGGATDLELGAPPSRLDAVVRTGRMARVLEYAPSDQIVAVEAGMTLEALQGTPVQLTSPSNTVYTQNIDELGNFIFSSITPATYTLELQFPEGVVVIDQLAVTSQE